MIIQYIRSCLAIYLPAVGVMVIVADAADVIAIMVVLTSSVINMHYIATQVL